MKKLIKDRKGIALGTALLFMIVLFSLSMLLVAIVMSVSLRINANDKLLGSRLEIDMMGEYALGGQDLNEGYGYTVKNGVYTITKNNNEVLIIELNENNEVKKWIYQ